MNERRKLIQKADIAGAALVAAAGSMAVQAAPKKLPTPVIRLREELLGLIRRLAQRVNQISKEVETLAGGEFEQLRINPASTDALTRAHGGSAILSFGPTDLCRIRVDPPRDGTAGGLRLEDPEGVVVDGGDLRILGNPVGDGTGAQNGVSFFDSFFDIDVECRGRATATADGMAFSDAPAYQFNGGVIQAVSTTSPNGEVQRGGLAFVDSFFDIDVECRGRAEATADGMLFSDAASYQFSSADIQAVSTSSEDGEIQQGGLAFVDSFFDIDVECRGRAHATKDGMFFSDATSFQFTGAEIRAVSTSSSDGVVQPGGLAFVDSFFDIDVECRGRIAATAKGMSFSDASLFGFDGVVTAHAFEQVSTGALKDNVRPIDDALAKVNALQGVYFDWKKEQGGHADVGFIGEAVNEVLPELVSHRREDGSVSGVKYANIVAVAIEGIKAQQQEIKQLEVANETLRQQMATLQAGVDALQGKVSGS